MLYYLTPTYGESDTYSIMTYKLCIHTHTHTHTHASTHAHTHPCTHSIDSACLVANWSYVTMDSACLVTDWSYVATDSACLVADWSYVTTDSACLVTDWSYVATDSACLVTDWSYVAFTQQLHGGLCHVIMQVTTDPPLPHRSRPLVGGRPLDIGQQVLNV